MPRVRIRLDNGWQATGPLDPADVRNLIRDPFDISQPIGDAEIPLEEPVTIALPMGQVTDFDWNEGGLEAELQNLEEALARVGELEALLREAIDLPPTPALRDGMKAQIAVLFQVLRQQRDLIRRLAEARAE